MIEILDIPAVRRRVAPLTVERYHRMIDAGFFDDWQVELLNGVLVEKMSKSPIHQFVVDFLVTALREACDDTEYWVRQEGPLTVGRSEPEPDVSVVLGSRAQFKRSNPVTAKLVIEVAVSSLEIDRAKAEIYARGGVPEYWIVCPEEQLTEVYRRPAQEIFAEHQIIPAAVTVECDALPGFLFNLTRALEE
jgi:Uma2 family endonuclease